MKYSLTGLEKGDLLIQVTAWASLMVPTKLISFMSSVCLVFQQKLWTKTSDRFNTGTFVVQFPSVSYNLLLFIQVVLCVCLCVLSLTASRW